MSVGTECSPLCICRRGFEHWLKPAAIRPRREAERALFVTGRYPAGTIPVWSVDRNGRVDFSRPIRRLTEDEALALLRPAGVPVSKPSVPAATPEPAIGWLARLTAFFSTLIRRA
jgi:lysozyme